MTPEEQSEHRKVFGLGLHVIGKAETQADMITPEPLRSRLAEHITAAILATTDIVTGRV